MREIDLGQIEVPYSGKFKIESKDFKTLQLSSSCTCLDVPRNISFINERDVNFTIYSKSDLVVINKKNVYLYNVVNGSKEHFETIQLKYS